MSLFSKIRKEIELIVEMKVAPEGYERAWFSSVSVEPPRDPSHGDMATNVAMVLAKRLKMNPRALAEQCAEHLRVLDEVAEVEVAGPGFINLRFAPAFWQQELGLILEDGVAYGASQIGAGKKINLEYVSANPTGPMHIGHARGAVVGDALAGLLLKAGYEVTKEYYINDAGAQIEVLARSAYLRYREACGEEIAIPEGLYPGDYLKAVGEGLFRTHGEALLAQEEAEWLPVVKPYAIDAMMAMIRTDLADMGVEHDHFFSEKSLHDAGKVHAVLEKMKALGLIYQGVLEPPKGKLPDDWEPREQTLFKSSEFGDDVDRALAKSDGSWTYFAADVAYAEDKIARGFDELIMVLGADHGGYVKRMQAAVKALSEGKVGLTIQLCQLVKFLEDGQPIKMSKRAGTFTTVRDVVEAVGKDVVRFIMLTRKPEQPLDFDLKKVTEQSRDNPVFYVQYAHARCKSLLRLAAEQMPSALAPSEKPTGAHLARLSSDTELALIRELAHWPRVVEAAAQAYEPHRIAYFLQELAASFHSFWNAGNDDKGLRFVIADDEELTIARHAVGNEPFAVILADDLVLSNTSCLAQMVEAYEQVGRPCNMLGVEEVPREKTDRYGILDIDAAANTGNERLTRARRLVEKPKPEEAPSTLSIIGRYLLQPEIFDYLEQMHVGAGGEVQITDAISDMIEQVDVYGYRFDGTRFDCGERVGFVEANLAFALADPEMKSRMQEVVKRYA
jgi:arginyl-tRNA synthetase